LAFGGRPPWVADDGGLVGYDLGVAPGLPHLAFAGRPPGVLAAGGFVVGVGDDGHAGKVHGHQHDPGHQCA
jgi:hypothetical protein